MHVRGRRSFSGAAHIIATPQRLHTLLFQCFALHFFATALPCFAFAMQPLPLPFCANPARCGAWAGVAFPMQILAYPCLSRTGLCFSGALRVQALPQPCVALPFQRVTWPYHSGAERHEAIPVRNVALLIRCISLLCTAPLCLCQATHCQCLVLLFYSAATHSSSQRCLSVPLRIQAPPFRRLSARTIACAVQSLVKNCPTQPSALRGRPFAQGAGWLIMVRMRWRSASGFSVPCSTTTSS